MVGKEGFMMISRKLANRFIEHLIPNKVVILFGPRQAGKTTLLRDIVDHLDETVLWLNGDEPDVRQIFPKMTSTQFRALIGDHQVVVIDEAQRIENIGLCLKLIVDNINVKVIASGSSSFELANRLNEPLTGRKFEFRLLPFSVEELSNHYCLLEERRMLERRLRYGSYPEVITSPGHEQEVIQGIADSYLYKDILTWERIQKPEMLERLVQALAYQIGSEVSYNELAQMLGIDNETVEKYLSLLEKAFIIFRLNSFSRNMRNELKKSRKIYFYDLGIRNAVIKNFAPLELRNDVGVLFENYLIVERMKQRCYVGEMVNSYFWRTHARQEIDYIEEKNGQVYAYEFKWNANKKVKLPGSFAKAYDVTQLHVITPENYLEWLIEE